MAEFQALGGTLSALNRTLSIVNTIDRAASIFGGNTREKSGAEKDRAIENLMARHALEEKTATQKSVVDRAILDAQKSGDDRRREMALRRAVARQRAGYGAAGTESDEGSAQAVLLGLYNESEQDKAAQESIYALRQKILDDNISAIKARNLLDLSQFVGA